MIRYSTRNLTPAERAAHRWRDPFHVLRHTATWQERNDGVVEILESSVEKAWLVWGCDRGGGCCPGSLLLRTVNREFMCLGGTVSSSPAYDFRWASSYKSGRCDGEHVVIERWPKTLQIYSVRFSGAPVKHVELSDPRLAPRWAGLRGCHVVYIDKPNELPEEDPHFPHRGT